MRLNPLSRTKQQLPKRDVLPLAAPARLNDTWAMDAMGDSLYSGRAFRLFNVCDNSREFLADAMTEWARQHASHLHCIEPGKPNQNAQLQPRVETPVGHSKRSSIGPAMSVSAST
jgi:putative transposase